MKMLGVDDLHKWIDVFEPRTMYAAELADRSWVPECMQSLIAPAAFPGAAVLVEYQVISWQRGSSANSHVLCAGKGLAVLKAICDVLAWVLPLLLLVSGAWRLTGDATRLIFCQRSVC